MGKRRGKRRLAAGHIICTHRGRGMMKTQLDQIAKKAKLDPKVRFTSLAHLLTPEFLTETWGMMNRSAASGIDGQTARQFERDVEQQVAEIHKQLKAGRYRAPPVRRVEIPKGPGKGNTTAGNSHGCRPAPATGGCAPTGSGLRSGLPRLQLWLQAWAKSTPRIAGTAPAHRDQEGKLRARGRHPQLLHENRPSVALQDGGPPHCRPCDPSAHCEMAEGRGHAGRSLHRRQGRRPARGADIACAP